MGTPNAQEQQSPEERVNFTVTLPLPPSANKLFANVPGKGRVKTRAYKNWRRNAILSIFAQVRADNRIAGPVGLSICVPTGMRGDLDNRLKATIDALVASNRIDDDKHVASILILRGGADKGTIEVRASGVCSSGEGFPSDRGLKSDELHKGAAR